MVRPPDNEPLDDIPPSVKRAVILRPLALVVRRWASRFGLVGLGIIMGVESADVWGVVGVGFLAIAVLISAAITFSIEADREIEAEVGPPRAAQKAADALRVARERAAEIHRSATAEADEIRTAAQLEAKLMVERARTAALALDPAAERQRRARRTGELDGA